MHVKISFIISEHAFQNWTYSVQRYWLSKLRDMLINLVKWLMLCIKSHKDNNFQTPFLFKIDNIVCVIEHVKASLFSIKTTVMLKGYLYNLIHKDKNMSSVSSYPFIILEKETKC